jgi:hypothetical protein
MTVADLIAQSYLKATGTVSTLTSSDSDWTKLLALANYYQQNWANEVGVDWRSLYDPSVDCGTVTATNTFNLATSIHKISQNEGDPVRIVHTDATQFTDYTVVGHDELKQYPSGNYCAQIGSTLVFNNAFKTTDAEFGGTINVPAYTLPSTLSADTDLVQVDTPEWLVTICAAEYTRNNLVRQNQYPNLLAEANQLMQKMIENNDAQIETLTLRPFLVSKTW